MIALRKISAGLLALLCVLSAYSEEPEEAVPDKEVVYKTVDEGSTELKLHIFLPPDHKPTDKRPAIVFFFGGYWNIGRPRQFYQHCKYLASRGMVAMSAEYRISKTSETAPRECIKDAKSAMRWIRRNAVELGVDPGEVIAGGGDAGGHLAAATGTTSAFNEEGENLDISCIPQALVLFCPLVDNGPTGYQQERFRNAKDWKDLSPAHNIDQKTPPAIFLQGTSDKLVSVTTAEKFQKTMQDKGRRCDLHLYKDQRHSFFNFRYKKNYVDTMLKVDRFLASLGYLKGEPTLSDDSGTEPEQPGKTGGDE